MNVNERLSMAVGWTFCTAVECGKWVHPRTGRHAPVPDYEHSMDALVRDVLPVLEARGWRLTLEQEYPQRYPQGDWAATFTKYIDGEIAADVGVYAATPAAALSEAAAIALEATNVLD